MNLLTSALSYLKRGFSVIPVEPRGKKPLVAWEPWQHSLPTSHDLHVYWEQFPCANVGIVTGQISGLTVVDLDTKEAKDNLKRIMGDNQVQGIPRTRTGRGWQLFFAYHAIGNKAGVIPGMDIRGDGGFVVVPPSLHQNGKTYTWEVNLTEQLPELPPALIELLAGGNLIGRNAGMATLLCAGSNPAPRQLFDTANALQGVGEGQRDDVIFKLACKLRSADIPMEMAATLVTEAAQNCTPPFPVGKAIEKVERAYHKYEARSEVVIKSAQPSFWPELIPIKQVIETPADQGVIWVWDEILPQGAASLLVAKPKVGKSNVAVNLSVAVSRGLPFFNRPTSQGRVGYIFMDGGMNEIAEVFTRFGVRSDDLIVLHSGAVPEQASVWLIEMVDKLNLSLVVVDTLQRFFRFKNLNDYSEVTNVMESLLSGIAARSCHVLFVHHAKKDSVDALDSAVGSTALRGLCYSFIHYRRLPASEQRVIMSDQRSGKNLPDMAVQFDWRTGWLVLNGSADDAEARDAASKIRELLAVTDGAMTEDQIKSAVQMRAISVSRALRDMHRKNEVERTGVGYKGRPFMYSLASSLVKEAVSIFKGRVINDL